MSDEIGPDVLEAVRAAISRGDAVVCPTRCYACQFGEHRRPPASHTWMERDDAVHSGIPWPMTEERQREYPCGCACAMPVLSPGG